MGFNETVNQICEKYNIEIDELLVILDKGINKTKAI